MVLPDLPFDEYHFCLFQQWRPAKITTTGISLVYGAPFSVVEFSAVLISEANPSIKDVSVFLIVIYSARHRSCTRARGVQSLLNTIIEDATVYFLLIFAGHILVILFEFFAPVSDDLANLRSSANDGLHIGNDSKPSPNVSHHLEHHNKDELNVTLSYL